MGRKWCIPSSGDSDIPQGLACSNALDIVGIYEQLSGNVVLCHVL